MKIILEIIHSANVYDEFIYARQCSQCRAHQNVKTWWLQFTRAETPETSLGYRTRSKRH